MSRTYSRESATRDAHPYAGAPDDADESYDHGRYGSRLGSRYGTDYRTAYGTDYGTDDRADYGAHDEADYVFPADYHDALDRRWIWVAGVAGAILMVAVICTGVILGGGDSGSVSAGQATTTSAQATTSAPATTSASPAAPLPVQQQTPALPPETIVTVTPTPTATATVTPVPPTTDTPPAPAVPPAPAADPAAAARTITYTVYGEKPLLDLVTVIYTDEQGALQTDVNVALPWRKTITLDPDVQLSSVTATSVTSKLNCSITDAAGAPLVAQATNTMIATCTK